MNDIEVRQILGTIKIAYPNSFRDMTAADRNALVELWKRQFADADYPTVIAAIDSIIATDTSGFMPSIGRVKEEIIKLTTPSMLTEQEAWNLVKNAIRGASVSRSSILYIAGQTDGKTTAQRNFEKLPNELQRIVGSPNQLADWGAMDSKVVDSVVASNFMRSYRVRIKSEREYLALPSDVRDMLDNLSGNMLLEREKGVDAIEYQRSERISAPDSKA